MQFIDGENNLLIEKEFYEKNIIRAFNKHVFIRV
jgi:hypothetical protein